jgi:formate dehydrogenase accessory protein FdhE
LREERGGPGAFDTRIQRAEELAGVPESAEPIAFLLAVLGHQSARAQDVEVQRAAQTVGSEALANRLTQRFPLLDLEFSTEAISSEIDVAVRALADSEMTPEPLRASGKDLVARPPDERRALIQAWLDDSSLVDPRLGLWIRVAAGPILELAAASLEPLSRDEWAGRACPVCGDVAQCSGIVEESGAFMQGAPRYLICGRCASWWAFPRAVCATCGEDDSTKQGSFYAEGRPWARIDVCDTCASYMKTFDLREKGARDMVPLVDDVGTLSLDIWAHENGLQRPGLSLAGV